MWMRAGRSIGSDGMLATLRRALRDALRYALRLPGGWWLSWLACVVCGVLLIAGWGLARLRSEFDAQARIVHRLLSQGAAQHDAILATLNLLQGEAGAGPSPLPLETAEPHQAVRRLPALYPQLLGVLSRRDPQGWPTAALADAEARSRQQHRAVLAQVEWRQGRAVLLRWGEPVSHALVLDLSRLIAPADWPAPGDLAPRYALRLGESSQVFALQPGRPDRLAWHHVTHKLLASPSQPFELVAERWIGAAELPWVAVLIWCLGSAALGVGLHAWRQQTAARRRAEDLLRLGQVGRLNTLGELAAGVAHELNQPLTAVLASTQAAVRVLGDDPPDLVLARQAMQHAAAQSRRASDVLTRLRRLVERPDTSRPAQSVHLADAAHEVLDLLAPDLASRQVRLSHTRLDDTPTRAAQRLTTHAAVLVQADPVALQQIVHNLLTNALQALDQVPATERGIELQVGVRRAASAGSGGPAWWGVLVVADSGPGLSDEALARVFEPFYSTRAGGLGLGLNLCETLALGMGGTLSAGHNTPRGARFELCLPLMDDRHATPPDRPSHDEAGIKTLP